MAFSTPIFKTASSGTTILVPAETPDGSRVEFTFTTAPVEITVDQGRSMQKVSSDGTVNWTGTTVVTLAIAPIFDIHALG